MKKLIFIFLISAVLSIILFSEFVPEKDLPQLKGTMTTVFWVGEEAGEDNDYISNIQSAWDDSWMSHYGGLDSPDERCGYQPCSFTPQENPFYFALPYNDLDDNDYPKESVKQIAWYSPQPQSSSILKNRWIEINYQDNTCYAQWEDVGPNGEDDFNYVFGENKMPKNTFGLKAGLDISPAVRDCLKMAENDITYWRFIDFSEIPKGPWTEIVTSSKVFR